MGQDKEKPMPKKRKWRQQIEKLKILEDWLKLITRVMYVILVFSLLILVWLKSFHLAATSYAALPDIKSGGDLSAILFGSAQVSLFVISILIAILTIFGWQAVEHKIQESVRNETKERLATLEKEVRGRSLGVLGYTLGEANVKDDFSDPINSERLREAIGFSDQAYTILKDSALPVEFMALNNFLIYSCALKDKSRRGYIVELAHKLRRAAEEHDNPNLLLTYCHTIVEFSLEPKEKEEASSVLRDIVERDDINDKQKREIRFLTSRFQEHGLLSDPMS